MAGGRRDDLVVAGYRLGAAAARRLPAPVVTAVARAAGRTLAVRHERWEQLRRHQARALGRPGEPTPDGTTAAVLASYAAYFADLLRLPAVDDATVMDRLEVVGWEHLEAALAGGRGVVLALPHLGSWEIGARYATIRSGRGLSAVVEVLRPPALFEWFRVQREVLDIHVIPLDRDAFGRVLADLGAGRLVCLLADRDLAGSGVEVEFFGERTTLPAGPALAALRAGVTLLPVSVYARPRGRYLGIVRPPVDTSRRGRLADDVVRITQDVAHELERLVRVAPEQWHLLRPNWPSDREGRG